MKLVNILNLLGFVLFSSLLLAQQNLIIDSTIPISQLQEKEIRIAFHVFAKDDGSANFQNNTKDIRYLNDIVLYANQRLANLGKLDTGTSPYIKNAKIKISLENIYFHKHTEDAFFNPNSASFMFKKYVIQDEDQYQLSEHDKYNVQHVFLVAQDNSTGGGRQVGGLGHQGCLVQKGWYAHYLKFGANHAHWGSVGNFIHEMGHALGLPHNFQQENGRKQCDACDDNDPVGEECPKMGTSNNYMDYFPKGYNSEYPGFSECQIRTMHQYLSGQRGNISRIVKD